MIRSYIITAFRSFLKNKWISIISLAGLSIGFAAGLLSYLHIQYEIGYDRFHTKNDRIYRLVSGDMKSGEGWVGISAPIPPKIKTDIPEVEEYVRLTKLSRHGKVVVQYDNQSFNEKNFFLADPSLFTVFDFNLITGDVSKLLENPKGLVLSKAKADKLFGDQNPVGQTIKINDEFEFEVTGIMDPTPINSHLDIDYVVSFQNLETMLPGTSLSGNWGQYNYYGYILLKSKATPNIVEGKIQSIKIPLPEYTHSFSDIGLQPMQDIHFVHNRGNLKPAYNRQYLYIYLAAALALILISVVNFVNLKIASSSGRVREVAVRKTLGASRIQLAQQYLAETLVLVFLSLLISVFLIDIVLLPYINNLFNADIRFDYLDPINIGKGLSFSLLISLISGSYIAFVITSFSPVKALKKQIKTGSGNGFGIRNVLLVTQFIISIMLIGSNLVMSSQIHHIADMNLGLNPTQVVNIPLYVDVDKEVQELLKNELSHIDQVRKVSLNSFNPGVVNWNQTVWWEGQEETESMYIISVDGDFFDALDIQFLEGDPLLVKENITDRYTYVLNNAAKRHIGWDQTAGKIFTAFGDNGKREISGVIEDFHFQSLHNQVKPCLLVVGNLGPSQIYLKIDSQNVQETLQSIQKKLANLLPNLPFEYQFLDDEFSKLYAAEQRATKIISFYTLICILLALFGLYGLMTFEISDRIKEIAIRKVLGANLRDIIGHLSRDFLKLILIAIFIAVPLAYLFMDRWLQAFAYSNPIQWWILILAGFLTFAFALLIVSFQSSRASLKNPVISLKNE